MSEGGGIKIKSLLYKDTSSTSSTPEKPGMVVPVTRSLGQRQAGPCGLLASLA